MGALEGSDVVAASKGVSCPVGDIDTCMLCFARELVCRMGTETSTRQRGIDLRVIETALVTAKDIVAVMCNAEEESGGYCRLTKGYTNGI